MKCFWQGNDIGLSFNSTGSKKSESEKATMVEQKREETGMNWGGGWGSQIDLAINNWQRGCQGIPWGRGRQTLHSEIHHVWLFCLIPQIIPNLSLGLEYLFLAYHLWLLGEIGLTVFAQETLCICFDHIHLNKISVSQWFDLLVFCILVCCPPFQRLPDVVRAITGGLVNVKSSPLSYNTMDLAG